MVDFLAPALVRQHRGGIFLQFCRKGFKIRFVQIGQKVLISDLFKFAAAWRDGWWKKQNLTPYTPQFGISRKTKPKNYLDVLRVDGHFITELKRKVRISAFCMVANCPHGICGQNGIPKFPQIGAELPAKSGNAKGRKSSDINRMKVPVVRCNMLSPSS